MEVEHFIHQSMVLKSRVIELVAHLKHAIAVEDVEDAFQQVMLKHVDRPELIQNVRERTVFPYLVRCTGNRLIDLWRSENRNRELLVDGNNVHDDADVESLLEPYLVQVAAPGDFVARIEAADLLRRATPRQQEILARLVEGDTQMEAAMKLGISRMALTTQLARWRVDISAELCRI